MTELQPYEPAMLQPATDSWTAVVEQIGDLAGKISQTDFVPQTYKGKPAQIAAAILHGRELGLAPLTSLAVTHIINGKPAISAEAMRTLVLQAGHDITFEENTAARCIIQGKRAGQETWTRVEWTLEDARQAGLTNNPNYKKYPRQMLAARATAELCRLIFADAIHGMKAIEELEEDNHTNGQTPTPALPTKEPNRVVARKPRTPQPPVETVESVETTDSPPQPEPERKRPTISQRNVEKLSNKEEEPPEKSLGEKTGERYVSHAGAERQFPSEEPGTDLANPGQITALQMHAQRLGLDDRDHRLTVIATLAGLEKLASTKDLTHHQATLVLDQLGTIKDRETLEERLNQLPPF